MCKFTPEMTLFEVSEQLGQLHDLLQIFNEMQDKEKVISATVELMRKMPLERVRCLYIHALTWMQINGKERQERNVE